MCLENGLESVSLVSFGIASGPDSAAQGHNRSKYESACGEMVVWAVCDEHLSVLAIPYSSVFYREIFKNAGYCD